MSSLRITLVALLAMLLAPAVALAAEDDPPIGLQWLVFPTFKGNSDAGVIVGGQLAMIDYADGVDPFAWELRLKANVGFKPGAYRQEHFLVFDTPHLLPYKLRFFLEAEFIQIPDANYYGIGNETVQARKKAHNQVKLTEPRVQANIRRALGEVQAVGGVTLAFSNIQAAPGSLLDLERPVGWEGGRNLSGLVGFAYDTRDNEIVTRSGMYNEIYSKFSLTPLSEYSWFGGGFTESFFWAPTDWIVLAQRVMLETLGGTVPLSELYRIGGTRNVRGIGGVFSQRGFKEGRFIGETKGLANFEIRGYFQPMFKHLVVGAGPFLDVSRIFDGSGNFVKVWHVSSGGEFTVNWKESFLFRLDYAVSKEGGEFYIEGRHIF